MPSSRVPRSWIFVFAGIVLLVVAIWATSPGPATTPSAHEEVLSEPWHETYEAMRAGGPNAILVEPQQAGASNVRVSALVTEAGGWVVIQADDSGVPGRVLGFAPAPFEGEDVLVHIDEPLAVETIYYALLYTDNGDGRFDVLTDRLSADASGTVALMSFQAL